MALTEEERARLAAQGKRFPVKRVSEQAAYAIGLAEKYKPTLLTSGATEEMLAALSAGRANLGTVLALQQAAVIGSHAATRAEHSTVTAAKGHLYKLTELVPMLIRINRITAASADDVLPKGTLGRSTAKLTNHLEKTRPLVALLDTLLKPHFQGESALAIHDKLAKDLQSLQASQSSKQRTLPNETFETNVAKGELVECIDNLNRIGRVAYIDQEVIARQFNKDLLMRRGKRKNSAAADADAPEKPAEGEEKADPGVTAPGKPTEPK